MAVPRGRNGAIGWILLGALRLDPAGGSEEGQVLADLAAVLSREDPPWPPLKLVLLAGNLTSDASPQAFQRVSKLLAELPGADDATVLAVPGLSDRNRPKGDQGLKLHVLRAWEDPDDEVVAEVRQRKS